MLWPTVTCSAVTTGLWIARPLVPMFLEPYADVTALAAIFAMFVWLAWRGRKKGIDTTLSAAESRSRARASQRVHRTET